MITKPDCDLCRRVQRNPRCDVCIPPIEQEYLLPAEMYLATWDQVYFPGGPYNVAAGIEFMRVRGITEDCAPYLMRLMRSIHAEVMKKVRSKWEK